MERFEESPEAYLSGIISNLDLQNLDTLYNTNRWHRDLLDSSLSIYLLSQKYSVPVTNVSTFQEFLRRHDIRLLKTALNLDSNMVDIVRDGQPVAMFVFVQNNDTINIIYYDEDHVEESSLNVVSKGNDYFVQTLSIGEYQPHTLQDNIELLYEIPNKVIVYDIVTIGKVLLRQGYLPESISAAQKLVIDYISDILDAPNYRMAKYVYLYFNAHIIDSSVEFYLRPDLFFLDYRRNNVHNEILRRFPRINEEIKRLSGFIDNYIEY